MLLRYLLRINFTFLIAVVGILAVVFFVKLLSGDGSALRLLSEGLTPKQQKLTIYLVVAVFGLLNFVYTISFIKFRNNFVQTDRVEGVKVSAYDIDAFSALKIFSKKRVGKNFEHDHSAKEA